MKKTASIKSGIFWCQSKHSAFKVNATVTMVDHYTAVVVLHNPVKDLEFDALRGVYGWVVTGLAGSRKAAAIAKVLLDQNF